MPSDRKAAATDHKHERLGRPFFGDEAVSDPQLEPISRALTASMASIADRYRQPSQPRPARQRVKHKVITDAQADAFNEAWLFALRSDTPLNLLVTIQWFHAPARSDGPQHSIDRIARLRAGLTAWNHRHTGGRPLPWVETREANRRIGDHVHFAFHVPAHLHLDFERAVKRLVANQSASVTDSAVDVRPVGLRWFDRRSYMLKAAAPDARRKYGMKRDWSPSQGVIEGPRVRVCDALGPTARRRASEKPSEGHSVISAVA